MKKLIYKIEGYTGVYNPKTEEVEQKLSLAEVIVENASDEDIARAAEIAYNGEYTIEDDGQQGPEAPETESSVYDELAAAYSEGVQSA